MMIFRKNPLLRLKAKSLKKISLILTVIMCIFAVSPSLPSDAAGRGNVIIVLDAGHGGEENGAAYNGIREKDINLSVALMAGHYLNQFEGVTVWLTRNSDETVSLADRAKLAHDAGADFFYSIHFNASESHALFGNEVWVSAFGEYYKAGSQFAQILLSNTINELGIYSRGCKTRLNNSGTDYYAVINKCTAYGIPSCIIEHCYIDNKADYSNYVNNETLERMAYLDAISIAQYFGLSSESLGLDFSGYTRPAAEKPECHYPDVTPPDTVSLSLVSTDAAARTATVAINGLDSESTISYFTFSLDGGVTWSAMNRYGGGPATVVLPIRNMNNTITICVYNQYDLGTVSNTISLR